MQKKLSDIYISALFLELSHILRKRMSFKAGLEVLRDSERSMPLKAMLSELSDLADMKVPLWLILSKTERFPDYALRMLELAERAGCVRQTLTLLSEYYERRHRFCAALRRSLSAPAMLLIAFLTAIYAINTRAMPEFEYVFRQLGLHWPPAAESMMSTGRALYVFLMITSVLFILIAFSALIIMVAEPLREKAYAWFYMKFGTLGPWGELLRSRFASALSLAVYGGFGPRESIDAAAAVVSGSARMDERIASCRDILSRDGDLAVALSESGVFSNRYSRLLALGFENGEADDVLDDIARQSEDSAWERFTNVIVSAEPVIVVIGSLAAGAVVLSMMLPLAGLMTGL